MLTTRRRGQRSIKATHTMIKVKDISKSYGSLQVLQELDLQVDAGEIISIVGKSGSGKSTLLHILGTLDKPDTGSIWIDDVDVTSLNNRSISDFRNQNIGFIFQFHHLLVEFSALENVMMPGMILGTEKQQLTKRATEILDYLGLGDRIDHKPSQLSGGEQQRVAVARALINNPKVVFADEPTGNLDVDTSQDLHNLLLGLRSEFNQTFVIVTHSDELAQLSDKKYTLSKGKLSDTSIR